MRWQRRAWSPGWSSTRARDADRDRPPEFASAETEAVVRRLIATRDPQDAYRDLISFTQKVEFSGAHFERFTHHPDYYRGRVFAVTSYPRSHTSIWHGFPRPESSVMYTAIPEQEVVEKLLFVTAGADGELRVDAVIDEPLDALTEKFVRGGLEQKLKMFADLGGRETRRKGRKLERLADEARDFDGSFVGGLLNLKLAPRRGRAQLWDPTDVFAFFGQAFSIYNGFPNNLASRRFVERVALVRKRLHAGDREKRWALDVTFPRWVRINPGKGGTMRFFLAEQPDGGLLSDVIHYDLRFMTDGDKLLRAHHEMTRYGPVEEGRGLLFPVRRHIRFRFKGEREGVRFDGFVEDDAPTGVDSYFSLRARFAGEEPTAWDRLVADVQGGRSLR